MPKYLRNPTVERNVLNTFEFKFVNKDFDPLTSKSKNFYAFLCKKAKHSRGFTKLMSDFNLDEEETRKAFYWQNMLLLKHLYNVFSSKF